MAITVTSITQSEFNTRLRNLLEQLEGRNKTAPYADTANPSHPTIGIGFDLTNSIVRGKVFKAMVIPEALKTALTTAITNSVGKTNAQIQTALDAAYGAPFVMTAAQIETAFKDVAASYVTTAQTSGLPYSNELVALTSLAFNGLYGPGTKAALALPDKFEARAEAWYQIRYAHIAGQNDKRRIAEAALFGLYEPGAAMSDEAALAVYRTYTSHSNAMIDRDVAYASLVSLANLELQAAGFAGNAASLEASLKSAADFLIGKYGQGQSFSALNIWVNKRAGGTLNGDSTNPNLLIGDAKADVLTGGGGNDVLVGGTGNDTLKGGAGTDTYVFSPGDGVDTIDDSDGLGALKVGTTQLTGQSDTSKYSHANGIES